MASANKEVIYLAKNASAGEILPPTAASAYKRLPIVTHNLRPNASSTASQLIRDDRMPQDTVRTGFEISGPIVTELMYGRQGGSARALHDVLEGVLYSTDWAAVVADKTGLTVTFDAVDVAEGNQPTIEITAGGDFATNAVGDYVRIVKAGNANHAILGRIKTIIAGNAKVVLDSLTKGLTDAAGVTSVTLQFGSRLSAGAQRRDYTVVSHNTDTGKFSVFLGVLLDGFQFTVAPNGIIQCTLNVRGRKLVPDFTGTFNLDSEGLIVASGGTAYDFGTILGGAVVAAPTNDVFNSIKNATAIINGAKSTVVTSFGMTVANNSFGKQVIGVEGDQEVGPGQFALTGQFEALWGTDTSLYEAFLKDTLARFAMPFIDALGQTYVFEAPAVRLTNAGTNNPGQNSDIPLQAEYAAKIDGTTNRAFTVCAFDALP